jgi:hypothetical protein
MTQNTKDAGQIRALAETVQRRIDSCCVAANTPGADYFDASTSLIIATRDLLAALTPTAEQAEATAKLSTETVDKSVGILSAPTAERAEAVAWQVRRADDRIDGVPIQWENCTKDLYDATLSTGRYAGYENGPRCEVRALVAAPASSAGDQA